MKYLLFSLFVFVCGSLDALTLKEKLREAAPGSYVVTEQGRAYTFLRIFEKTEGRLVLEEVTIPEAQFKNSGLDWRSWFEQGAPGNTSWALLLVNLETGVIEEGYSVTYQGWINTSKIEGFLSQLLNLEFNEVTESERRRVGLPPGYNKRDTRPLWNPRLIVEGQQIKGIPFTVWQARWPSDGSELSRKRIEVYLPLVDSNSMIPSFFPYWIEVDGKIGSAKVRVVDSGMNSTSLQPYYPYQWRS